MSAKRCPPHYCDNQGLCHYCGMLMEPDWYAAYAGDEALAALIKSQQKGSRNDVARIRTGNVDSSNIRSADRDSKSNRDVLN